MVKCNVIGCTEDASVRVSDCENKQYIYLCYRHREERRPEVLEIDHYQKWENMDKS